MEVKFTEQESFDVINEMINRARNNIQKGSANTMIFTGYAIVFVAIVNFILLHVLPAPDRYMSYMVWWSTLIIWIIDRLIDRKIDRSAIVKTQIDGIISIIWKGFGFSISILLLNIMSIAIVFEQWSPTFLITSSIMVIIGIVQLAMSKACRYRPFLWSAVIFWTGALLCTFGYCVLKRDDLHLIILAVCMIAGFIIPGHLLNKKAKQNV
jgi:hypothetical protein